MRTTHRIHTGDARDMQRLPDASVALVVTSPPYPMIEMWDACFTSQDAAIGRALDKENGAGAFEAMHAILDGAWREVHRVLIDGGIACVNVGDATRTLGGSFTLWPNHARVLSALLGLGFSPLPGILWRKPTNAPNKFMGSGMLAPGAYVTLEHEHVLIVRKGGKREFAAGAEQARRRESAYFWEERNAWFSDVWMELRGARQSLGDTGARQRSGAFPFELPYRLISMFSIRGDTVLDPFLGAGTTTLAALATARESVGFEIDAALAGRIAADLPPLRDVANARVAERLTAHAEFARRRHEAKGPFGYANRTYGFPVVTRQERDLVLDEIAAVEPRGPGEIVAEHAVARAAAAEDWSALIARPEAGGDRETESETRAHRR